MRISVAVQTDREDFLALEVGPETTVGLLKANIAVDAGIADDKQGIVFNERILSDDSQTLDAAGVKDGDMVIVREVRPAAAAPSGEAPRQPRRTAEAASAPRDAAGAAEGEALRLEALRNPAVAAAMRQQRPELADALQDAGRFQQAWAELQRSLAAEKARQEQRIRELESEDAADDPEKQREIMELIRMQEVEKNRQHALEWLPESFGRVYMLYIPVEVNGQAVKAFVDSGAQTTIVSPDCAARCGIMRLLDTRYAGMARGVGTARILGRVHAAQMRIGASFLGFSATVMEGKGVDLLLGLDMLKGFRACIDLGKGVLRIGDDEVPFLGEADIPKDEGAELEESAEDATVPGPAGTRVDGRTGTVIAPGEGGSAAAGSAAAAPPSVPSNPPSAPAPQRQQSSIPAAASAPAALAARRPVPGPAAQAQPPRESIEQLQAMGFTEAEAIQALVMAGGNVDVAASMLFGG